MTGYEPVPDDYAGDETRLRELRRADVDRLAGAYRSRDAIEGPGERSVDRLLDRIGENRVRAYLDRNGSEGDGGTPEGT